MDSTINRLEIAHIFEQDQEAEALFIIRNTSLKCSNLLNNSLESVPMSIQEKRDTIGKFDA